METANAIKFQDANRVQNGVAAARRDAAKLTVSRTGAVRSNTEGKALIAGYVTQMGGDPNNYQLAYKGAEEVGAMGLYLAQPDDRGVMNVKIYENAVVFHAGGCFENFPRLRPAQTVDCHIAPAKDAKGNPCLAVHVQGGSATHTVKRRKRQSQPVAEVPPVHVQKK